MKHIYVNNYVSFYSHHGEHRASSIEHRASSIDHHFLFYYTYQEVKLLPSAPFAGSGSPLSIIPPPPPPPPVLIAYGFDVLIPGMAAFWSGF
jgi:hypothetical protein